MPVYKNYDQAALNLQYNNRMAVPDHERHLEQWESLSRSTERNVPHTKDIVYGSHPRERLDFYPSKQPGSGIMVFIHGGYWYKMDKSDFLFVAEGFSLLGLSTALISYPLAPEATMDDIVASCRRAIKWVVSHSSKLNEDENNIYVSGHSAGGHLAAMMMAQENGEPTIPQEVIKGCIALSGLHNLEPIMLSERNEVLSMDPEMAMRNSPVQQVPANDHPLIAAVGADETNEYLAQSQELSQQWSSNRKTATYLPLVGINHFSIVETLLDQESQLYQATHQMIQTN